MANKGASASPSGSHPSGHAASGVDGASRFDPSRLRAMADECEAANCPADVTFGRDILLASGWTKYSCGYFLGQLFRWHSPDNSWSFDDDHFKDPTRDLAMARRILPRATLWAVGSMEDGPFARLCWPMPDGSYLGGYVEGQAVTAELSLCAAALRGQAIAMEAAEAVETAGLHPKDDSAGRNGIAQSPAREAGVSLNKQPASNQ